MLENYWKKIKFNFSLKLEEVMKKIFLIFCLMLLSFSYATDWNSEAALNRVNTIGSKMLKANNVNYPIEFKVSDEEDVNAYANLKKSAEIEGFSETPYKSLLRLSNNNVYQEILTYQTLIINAKRRNKIFFKKLGIE